MNKLIKKRKNNKKIEKKNNYKDNIININNNVSNR